MRSGKEAEASGGSAVTRASDLRGFTVKQLGGGKNTGKRLTFAGRESCMQTTWTLLLTLQTPGNPALPAWKSPDLPPA